MEEQEIMAGWCKVCNKETKFITKADSPEDT